MKDPIKQNDIYYALIVTYQPSIERLRGTAENLTKQGFHVLIVDNGSANSGELVNVVSGNDIIFLDQNYGIARALNAGMEEACKRGAEWVMSSDQDTMYAENVLQEYLKYTGLENAGALCPRVIRPTDDPGSKENEPYKAVRRCPTSGFFCRTDVWESVGQYDEWMFIDYVDYDLCIRIEMAGLKIYQINTTHIIQELGKVNTNRFFMKAGEILRNKKMKNFAVTYNHSPFRNYYFVRNSLYYIHKYKGHIDMTYEKKHLLKWEVKKLLLEPHKLDNLKAACRGFMDYRRKIETE